jgi:myo-inositol-1(or 4)-monophosphatase
MTSASDDRVDHVEAVARAGADVALDGFRTGVAPETKGGADRVVDAGDVVTTADRGAQRACLDAIRDRFPDDAVVAEEEDARKTLPGSGVVWVVDPIDGTYNFARDLPAWATAVAVVADGGTIAAATVAPALGEAYAVDRAGVTRVAGRADGSRGGTPLSVSERETPEAFAVAYAVVPRFGDRGAYADGVADMVERFGETRRVGSLQLVLARVAAGALEGTVTPQPVNPWDSVGGVRMIRAAGGVVTDVDGDPWHPGSDGLVASNGAAHGELLAVARRMAGER